MVLACMLFWSVISYECVSRFVCGTTQVVGRSMMPTLTDGERHLVDRLAYRFRLPHRGEIVAIRLPEDDFSSVKRIIALPGERIQIKDNAVYVQGRRLDEPYLAAGVRTLAGCLSDGAYEVGPSCYFVLGDNRDVSADSRYFGAVRRDCIIGRLLVN